MESIRSLHANNFYHTFCQLNRTTNIDSSRPIHQANSFRASVCSIARVRCEFEESAAFVAQLLFDVLNRWRPPGEWASANISKQQFRRLTLYGIASVIALDLIIVYLDTHCVLCMRIELIYMDYYHLTVCPIDLIYLCWYTSMDGHFCDDVVNAVSNYRQGFKEDWRVSNST